jgi:hypothetical protein
VQTVPSILSPSCPSAALYSTSNFRSALSSQQSRQLEPACSPYTPHFYIYHINTNLDSTGILHRPYTQLRPTPSVHRPTTAVQRLSPKSLLPSAIYSRPTASHHSRIAYRPRKRCPTSTSGWSGADLVITRVEWILKTDQRSRSSIDRKRTLMTVNHPP